MRPRGRGDREVGHDVAAADQLEGDVDRPRRGGDLVGERVGVELAGREHRVVEPERRGTARASRRCGRCRPRCSPSAVAELHRGGADARARPRARAPSRPAAIAAWVTIASWAVMNTSGTPPAATRSSASGTRAHCAAGTASSSACAAAAGDAEHPRADRGRGHARRRARRPRPRTRGPGCRPATRAAPGSSPRSCARSARLRPAPCTRTSTSPGPGSGSGRSVDHELGIGRRSTSARIGASYRTAGRSMPGAALRCDDGRAGARGPRRRRRGAVVSTPTRRVDALRAHRRPRRGDGVGLPAVPQPDPRGRRARRPPRRRAAVRACGELSSSPTTRRRCTSTCATSQCGCRTARWRDPGAEEWAEVIDRARRARRSSR